jgi:hypothetical protein
LQRDYPGYIHIQIAPTAEMRVEALTIGDFSYIPNTPAEEITTRHKRLLHMANRIRNPLDFKSDPLVDRDMTVLFIGDRNVGNDLRTQLTEGIDIKSMASVAGALVESKKHDAVMVFLGGKEDAKERFTFLQVMLKDKNTPPKALYFQKEAPERMKAFCQQNGVTVIESQDMAGVRNALLALRK